MSLREPHYGRVRKLEFPKLAITRPEWQNPLIGPMNKLCAQSQAGRLASVETEGAVAPELKKETAAVNLTFPLAIHSNSSKSSLSGLIFRTVAFCSILLSLNRGSGAPAADRSGIPDEYHWFSAPINISGLPPGAAAVPVICRIDFSALGESLKATGVVDERSLRLFRLGRGEKQMEIPVQFTPEPQPRIPKRQLRPGTGEQVSYLAEYPVSETPPGIRVAGQLSWLAESDASGRIEYRLQFGIPRSGSAAQVPYPPYNLRAFDDQQRATALRNFPRMQIRPQQPLDGVLNIFELNQPVTSYNIGPAEAEVKSGTPKFRRPFFYPVNGPDGISLTEFGKPHDPTGSHAHHYSLWIAHASIDGHDFWAERGGLIVHEAFDELEDGPVFCRMVQRVRWIDDGADILRERRQFRFYRATAGARLIDVEFELTPAASKPVQLGKTNFGFLAARVAQSLSPFDGGGEILNSNGDRNEQRAHLKHADWLDQSGPTGPGTWAGVAILDHPQNTNHPTAFHCRNDGWAGPSFNLEKPFTLAPETTLRLKYRILLHPGTAAEAHVSRYYEAFSATPTIEVGFPQKL